MLLPAAPGAHLPLHQAALFQTGQAPGHSPLVHRQLDGQVLLPHVALPPQQVQNHAVQLLQAQGAKPVPKILSLQAAKHLDPIRHTILLSLHFSTIVFYKNRHGKSIYKTHKIGNPVRQ